MTSLCPLAVSSLCQLMGAEGPSVLTHLQSSGSRPRPPAHCLLSPRLPGFAPGWGPRMPG